MKKVPINKNECCGCSGCVDVCPCAAIKMKEDEEGFLYPCIDESICIDCGICGKMCAFANYTPVSSSKDTAICYVAKHKNLNVRMNSRSGGVFVSCSDWVLRQNGVVYGCILDHNLKAVHFRTETADMRNKMCRSKYVQSDTRNIFPQVKTDLEAGRTVLFSGTGCQVDGVKAYLKQKKTDTSHFYTIDIVCHGCVSPKIYSDYISFLEKKYKGNVTDFDFRDKTACGWDGHIETFVIHGKKRRSVAYRNIFYSNLSIRPSCYHCKYATISHPADVTIADAWGIKTAKPEFHDNRGVSLLLVNSEKGQEMLEQIEKECETAKLSLTDMMQPNLREPSKPNGDREKFWSAYRQGGIERIVKNYGAVSVGKRMKVRIKYKVRQILQGKKYYLP